MGQQAGSMKRSTALIRPSRTATQHSFTWRSHRIGTACAAMRGSQNACDRWRCPKFRELVRVAFKPYRPGLPIRQGSVSITDRHLDLRQTLGVEHFVLRDDAVYVEQKCRQCVYLIGGQRSLSIEGHGAIDVIPDRG